MTPHEALTIALHRIRHRMSEPGWTPEPCAACGNEARDIEGALPEGFGFIEYEAWRREHGRKTMAERRYRQGVTDGVEQEQARIKAGMLALFT